MSCASSTTDGGLPEFEGATYASIRTGGGLGVSFRFAPAAAPARGVNAVEMHVVDAWGSNRDGLATGVIPWMPAMNHGAAVTPSVTALGDGRYRADNLDLFMPGRWQLRLTLTDVATNTQDSGTLEFQVP
jgi:hypothetical protein